MDIGLNTPLCYAAKNNDHEMVSMLMTAGANIDHFGAKVNADANPNEAKSTCIIS